MTELTIPTASHVERLKACGDPRETWGWSKGKPDYVQTLNLLPDDVPALLKIARSWNDIADRPDDDDETGWYAPIHAWRALAQLRAPEAIALLLEMLGPMDARGDDWHLEEFPDAFAMIGPPAFDPVFEYLSEPSRGEYARICAAHALCRIAQVTPDYRDRAAERLISQLSKYEKNTDSLNAFLISYLIDLRATEAAVLIERAFAAGHVDELVVGDWRDVRDELGVEGTGLIPDRPNRQAGSGPRTDWILGLFIDEAKLQAAEGCQAQEVGRRDATE